MEAKEARPGRNIGLLGATSIIIGFVIGASIFILPGPVAGKVGPGLPIAYLLAVLPAVFACLYLVQLGSALPVTGASYVAATRFGTAFAGYQVVWMYIVCAVSALPVMAIGFAAYLKTFVPSLNQTVTAIMVIVALGLLNMFGIKTVAIAQTIMTAVFSIALGVYIFGGLPHVDVSAYSNPFPNGLTGLIVGAITVYFSFTGFNVIAEVSGDIKNPRRNIPRAIVISIVAILAVYVLVAIVVTGTLDWKAAGESPAAVADSASLFYSDQIVGLISMGALFASATTINALLTSVVRDIQRLAEDGVLPDSFSKTTPKGDVPYQGVLFIVGLVVLAILTGLDISQYSMITVLAVVTLQCITAAAIFRMKNLAPDLWERSPIKFNRAWSAFTLGGILITSAGIFVLVAVTEAKTLLIFAATVLVGVVLWVVRKSMLKSRGVNIASRTAQFSEDLLEELRD